MGLFNRKTTDATGGHHHSAKTNGHHTTHEGGGQGFINQRPSVGTWFKTVWIDIITMACMGAIGLGIYMAKPAPTRNFPILFKDGEVVYPEFAYPLRKNIIPIWLAAFLGFFIPATVFLICQIRVKSFWDFNNAILGLLYSLINGAVFQVFIKWLIGGLRPHFLAVCKPDLSNVSAGSGFQNIMFTRAICTGDDKEINDSLESMPSGHSTASFAGFIFLFLYLNAKLKLWSNYHPAYWKMIAVYAPVLGACLIAGSLTIDEFHNWYDCFAGAVIGTFCAFGAYRMVYAAIWDWRYNHIPLPRGDHGTGFSADGNFGGFEHAVFTRKGGWGAGEGYGHHHHTYKNHGGHWGRRSGTHTTGTHHTTGAHHNTTAPVHGDQVV